MKKREMVAMQEKYVELMVKHLPVLRTAINMTQAQLAEKVGVSRQTIVAIETRKRPLPLTLYLALVFVFQCFNDSQELLERLELFDRNI
jgi:DNA-binding XRE family transcriptional regulator